MTTRRTDEHRHKTLEERLTAFYGVPVEQLERTEQPEYDWGGEAGEEEW